MAVVFSASPQMIRYFTSQTFERSAALAATAVALPVKRVRSLPAMLVPALLLALVFGRMLDLAFSMLVADGALIAAGPAGAAVPDGALPTVWAQTGTLLADPTDASPGPRIARGRIEGLVMIETAFLRNSDAARQLPPPSTFLSNDTIPFQLRTADLTTDAAICSGVPRAETVGGYLFDFHDGGLSWGEVYNFLTFVTQGYRPVSLRDQRLLLPRAVPSPAPDHRYVAR